MGYGKTTAVREYLNHTGAYVLWQRHYETSYDSFWKGFCRLFRELNDDCSQSLIYLGFPDGGVSVQEVLNLIEEIKLPPKTVLVIAYIYLAAANKQIFREQAALSNLKQALEIAMPDRMYMPFVEN